MQDAQCLSWDLNTASPIGISSAGVPYSTFSDDFAVSFEPAHSNGVLDLSQNSGQGQQPRPGSPREPQIVESAICPTQQAQFMNVAPAPENSIVSPSMPTRSSNLARPLPRRRSHRPKTTHPAMSPIEPFMHHEVRGLVDTTHFERFPSSIPRTRITRGRSPGYYGTLGGSEESSDDLMESGDEWVPSRA